jgi:hypothetical protein
MPSRACEAQRAAGRGFDRRRPRMRWVFDRLSRENKFLGAVLIAQHEPQNGSVMRRTVHYSIQLWRDAVNSTGGPHRVDKSKLYPNCAQQFGRPCNRSVRMVQDYGSPHRGHLIVTSLPWVIDRNRVQRAQSWSGIARGGSSELSPPATRRTHSRARELTMLARTARSGHPTRPRAQAPPGR